MKADEILNQKYNDILTVFHIGVLSWYCRKIHRHTLQLCSTKTPIFCCNRISGDFKRFLPYLAWRPSGSYEIDR